MILILLIGLLCSPDGHPQLMCLLGLDKSVVLGFAYSYVFLYNNKSFVYLFSPYLDHILISSQWMMTKKLQYVASDEK